MIKQSQECLLSPLQALLIFLQKHSINLKNSLQFGQSQKKKKEDKQKPESGKDQIGKEISDEIFLCLCVFSPNTYD